MLRRNQRGTGHFWVQLFVETPPSKCLLAMYISRIAWLPTASLICWHSRASDTVGEVNDCGSFQEPFLPSMDGYTHTTTGYWASNIATPRGLVCKQARSFRSSPCYGLGWHCVVRMVSRKGIWIWIWMVTVGHAVKAMLCLNQWRNFLAHQSPIKGPESSFMSCILGFEHYSIFHLLKTMFMLSYWF